MLCSLLALAALATQQPAAAPSASLAPPPPAASAPRTASPASDGRWRWPIRRPGVAIEDLLGGTLDAGAGWSVTLTPVFWPNLYELSITGTGTPYAEQFLLQVPMVEDVVFPTPPPSEPRPLLAVYHQFSASHYDALFHTDFPQEALRRDWFLFAPLGGTSINFSNDWARQNTRVALDWVLANFTVDTTRLYGVGFSMGGGWCLNFAATQLDPTRGMFAALVNNTGSVAVSDVYWSNPSGQIFLDILFGGSPDAEPYEYRQASAIELDKLTRQVVPGESLAHNLTHIPIETWYSAGDPNLYLREQNDRLHEFLTSIGGNHVLQVKANNHHRWAVTSEFFRKACDFLEQHQLSLPTSGTTFVIEDGRHFHFEVAQETTADFTRFEWSLDAASNALSLGPTTNLARLTLVTLDAGLDPGQPLTVTVEVGDGSSDEIVLEGYAQPPLSVERDGASASFDHNAVEGTVTFVETDATQSHVWIVTPL